MDRVIVFDTTLRDGQARVRAYLSALNRIAKASSHRMKDVGP